MLSGTPALAGVGLERYYRVSRESSGDDSHYCSKIEEQSWSATE